MRIQNSEFKIQNYFFIFFTFSCLSTRNGCFISGEAILAKGCLARWFNKTGLRPVTPPKPLGWGLESLTKNLSVEMPIIGLSALCGMTTPKGCFMRGMQWELKSANLFGVGTLKHLYAKRYASAIAFTMAFISSYWRSMLCKSLYWAWVRTKLCSAYAVL